MRRRVFALVAVPAPTVLQLPPLHPAQHLIATHPARYRVACCGVRFGKTQLGTGECLRYAAAGGIVWWVAPSYIVARPGWRVIKDLAMQLKAVWPGIRIVDSEPCSIHFPHGGELYVRSADDPDKLHSEGLDFVVLDEAAYMDERVWEEAIMSRLLTRRGRALFISTPMGYNWFWRLYQHAEDEPQEWAAFHYTTYDNPFNRAADIDKMAANMTDTNRRRLIMAEFIEDTGEVFRGVRETAVVQPGSEERQEGHLYIGGLDFGRAHDYTVMAVIDALTGRMVDIDRFNRVSWELQRNRIKAMHDRWGLSVLWAEANAVGNVNIEELHRDGVPVRGFNTSSHSKGPLIDALAIAIERKEVALLDDQRLIGELLDYRSKLMPSGIYHYAAAPGGHDDMVIATALAWHGVKNRMNLRLIVLE